MKQDREKCHDGSSEHPTSNSLKQPYTEQLLTPHPLKLSFSSAASSRLNLLVYEMQLLTSSVFLFLGKINCNDLKVENVDTASFTHTHSGKKILHPSPFLVH